MTNDIVNFNLYLVIEQDDDFYRDILPNLFIALDAHNVLFKLSNHDLDGVKHFVLTGPKGAIEKVVRDTFAQDEGVLDTLDDDYYFD